MIVIGGRRSGENEEAPSPQVVDATADGLPQSGDKLVLVEEARELPLQDDPRISSCGGERGPYWIVPTLFMA